MKITEKDVLHTATLAHRHLKQEELAQTAEDLKNILTCFNKLQDLNTHDIAPFEHPKEKENRLRQDISEVSLLTEKIAGNAPTVQGPFLKVPKIIEGLIHG